MGLPPDPDIDSFLRVRPGRVGIAHRLAVLHKTTRHQKVLSAGGLLGLAAGIHCGGWAALCGD